VEWVEGEERFDRQAVISSTNAIFIKRAFAFDPRESSEIKVKFQP
jgi:hypothetical protein